MTLQSKNGFTVNYHPPKKSPVSYYSTLPPGIPLESLPSYQPEHCYSLRIGDVYLARYQVSGKIDSFNIRGPAGNPRCLVLQPMQESLLEMMKLNPKLFNLPLLKMTVKRLLLALDFLHTKAGKSLLIHESYTIYQSRRFRRPAGGRSYGLPMLCAFSEAQIRQRQQTGPFVQPHIYRAAEIIFEMPWGSSVDIWNLAGLGHDLFKHRALMVSLIRTPPGKFVGRSEMTEQCFDFSGSHTVGLAESLQRRLSGQAKGLFIQFLRSMLKRHDKPAIMH
ncbi:uncharacterized protein BDW43DRAFT_302772 [Aspergillus alliaceus]|uniref:uncharacterized protein n=1 Tax=Petromyces alliaceus TaxID=209559 RepID=UPI0012A704A4|nr:uncharacterized protein BDW43DRAFT_302772 [Aspergillus alliaceus]KAB8230006.1 hypothetical protein BDW43DRAFT_302772 [Aspergillus alliaceus]